MLKIKEAQLILKELGLPDAQQNEISGYTLLALCNVKENNIWKNSKKISLGISKGIMFFVSEHYHKNYAPNTRETFRRQVLHQFIQAGIVDYNPDNLNLPVNSPQVHYALSDIALKTIKNYGSKNWKKSVFNFNEQLGSLYEKYKKKRDIFRIPIELPNGKKIKLSPGRHNEVQAAIVKEFASRFAKGSTLLYLGDTENKDLHVENKILKEIGIPISEHSKMPDVIIYNKSKDWIYLIEAVTSHGPMSPKRIIELEFFLKNCTSGKIFVSAFPDFSEFKKHTNNIAWDTEVWIMEFPEHMIHFNGDRFYGPRVSKLSESAINIDKKQMKQILKKGLNIEQILEQIELIKKGTIYADLIRPAGLNDGIKKMTKDEENFYLSFFEKNKTNLKLLKFVPASGAASRMFLDLLTFYNDETLKTNTYIDEFISGIERKKFAFTDELNTCMNENGFSLKDSIKNKEIRLILKYLLTDKGMNYANLPKAVLKFHINNNINKTPIDEQINEGINYAKGKDDMSYLHFTISSEFKNIFLDNINIALDKLKNSRINISFSEQKEYTQTIALNMSNELFREDDNILFRPGGHGALIENLNDLDGDIIFIKNIDNVVNEEFSETTNYYKKIIAGYIINLKNKVFEYRGILDSKIVDKNLITKIINYATQNLNIIFENKFYELDDKTKIKIIKNKLSRPIRVCGMVKNEGEPGGGPYWVRQDNEISLQIIESASVNKSNKSQMNVFKKAEFFNPVDIICAVKDYKGVKYDLKDFIDKKSFFISEKSKNGNTLKALELPGLWNGAMSDWITIFVEVPIITFNPVKTVNDLLKKNHQENE